MRTLSAQYIFDGNVLHKLAKLHIDDKKELNYLEESFNSYQETAKVEFYNGIICLNTEQIQLENCLKTQNNHPEYSFSQILQQNSKQTFNSKIYILENVDLVNLKIQNQTTIRQLI